MFNTKSVVATFSVVIVAALIFAFKPENEPSTKEFVSNHSEDSFAVVELFTSEGCSSCPPADRLLGNILKKARSNGKNIYALAFHVDYWNDLGWKDIYSSADFSHRQRTYARALNSSVYTPQMIINGKDQFVGSNGGHARRSINNSLRKSAEATVALDHISQPSSGELQIDYKVSGDYSGNVLNIAVVERGIVRDIKRGENTGLTMHHENVVRAFRTTKLDDTEGKASLKLPSNLKNDHASVIAYVQNPSSKEIVGAGRKDL